MRSERRIRITELLRYVNDSLEILVPLTRRGTYQLKYKTLPDWEDYFPSVVKAAVNKLQRQGLVEKRETPSGILVKITAKGKRRVLTYRLEELEPKTGKWDGSWRLVFFDVPELERHKRNRLRRYLLQLGMKQIQESVFVSPYDVFSEIEFIREVLEIPHGVKMATLKWIENEEELKEIFEVG